MQRREFSKLMALLACSWPAGATSEMRNDDWSQPFAQALRERPWLAAWGNIEREHYRGEAATTGRWPEALRGTLFRTGPAQHEVHGYRNHHWFDGDGMVQAWRIGGNGVRHQARLVETAKVQAERRAGRALYPGLMAAPPRARGLTGPDDLNLANISVLHHHGRLLALWEAGSPYEIDPANLTTVGTYSFAAADGGSSMRGAPFSAHPRVDADGSVWNFGYASSAGLLVLWHVGPGGALRRAGTVAVDPMTMPHDFVVTERHLVLLLPPFHYRPEAQAQGFLNQHEWCPEDPCRVLVVDKNDFASHYFLDLPAQWIFHFGNAWEDRAGVIRFDGARAPDPGVMTHTFMEVMRGNPVYRDGSLARHHSYRIDTRSRSIAEQAILEPGLYSEFPSVDPRVSCRRYRKLVFLSLHAGATAAHGTLNEVSLFDIESGRRDFFRYPDGQIPEEHLYVPRPGNAPESGGWILGTAFDWQRRAHVLNLFDAEGVADGPVAAAELPYAIPLGLHGKFVAG